MFSIHTSDSNATPMSLALQAVKLCKQDSEMQDLFTRICSGGLNVEDSDVIVACAYRQKLEDQLIGWASVGPWWVESKMRLQIQSYVHEDFRKCGVATACIAAATLGLPRSTPVAVFSNECERIATRLRLNSELWKRVPDGWIRSSGTEGGHSE